MRILHTADWHLGHTLHDQPRDFEHARFLDWLLDRLEAEAVDALLIAGDLFDTANPSSAAQALWFSFLARARARVPHLQVVAIAGNHDAPARLEAPHPILASLGVTVVGQVQGRSRPLDPDQVLVPLHDAEGSIRAWAVALPFLRPADLPPCPEAEDPLIDGVASLYRQAVEAAEARRTPDQALIGLGHLYAAGGRVSELSERRILLGNQHALPASLFPEALAYVALGHLHKAQKVGGREEVRYSGSPLPLSLGEADYHHQVVLVELDGPAVAELRPLPVPRPVELLRLPAGGPSTPEAALAALSALEVPDRPPEERPFLEVRVRLGAPAPDLRRQVEQALDGKPVRLVKVSVDYAGGGGALADGASPGVGLAELSAEEVFRRRHEAVHDTPPSPDLLADFAELLDEVSRDEAEPSEEQAA